MNKNYQICFVGSGAISTAMANVLCMKDKYSVFLPHASCKSDLYRIMEWMCSELAVGHHRFGSRGDRMNSPDRIQTGLLGADFVVNNEDSMEETKKQVEEVWLELKKLQAEKARSG